MIALRLVTGRVVTLDGDQEGCQEVAALLITMGMAEEPPSRPGNMNDAARTVFAYWKARCSHPLAKWTGDRARVLLTRLNEESKDPHAAMQGLCRAVDGALLDPWFNGRENGRGRLLDFENIFVHRGRNRIERFQRIAGEARQKDVMAARMAELLDKCSPEHRLKA